MKLLRPDTNNFIPLLSEKQSEIVIELQKPQTLLKVLRIFMRITMLVLYFHQGGERKFVIPAEDNSDAILGVYDYGHLNNMI